MSSSSEPVDLRCAKSDDYRAVLKKILDEGNCPFCPEYLAKHHKNQILSERGEWLITESQWPYENAACHFLVIGKSHCERLQDLTILDFFAVFELMRWAVEKFNLPGGAMTLRFGDTRFTGATVRHLHFHLIVPEEGKAVSFPVG